MATISRPGVPKFDLPSNQAVRVTLSYQGKELRLVSRKVLSMRTPPSAPLEISEKQAGFWFQIEDANGHPLYRRVMQNPIQFDTETPSDDPERPLKRVPLREPRGTFYLLVPLLREARTVRIFSSPFELEKAMESAGEIMRFNVFDDITASGSNTVAPSSPNKDQQKKPSATHQPPNQDGDQSSTEKKK
jgi:hypothetical protein